MKHAVANSLFDEQAWKSRLAEIKAQIPSCGQVYELFAQRFSDAVNDEIAAMDDSAAERARAIALLDSDYFDDSGDEGEGADTCPHGLDVWTCPAGCGG